MWAASCSAELRTSMSLAPSRISSAARSGGSSTAVWLSGIRPESLEEAAPRLGIAPGARTVRVEARVLEQAGAQPGADRRAGSGRRRRGVAQELLDGSRDRRRLLGRGVGLAHLDARPRWVVPAVACHGRSVAARPFT